MKLLLVIASKSQLLCIAYHYDEVSTLHLMDFLYTVPRNYNDLNVWKSENAYIPNCSRCCTAAANFVWTKREWQTMMIGSS